MTEQRYHLANRPQDPSSEVTQAGGLGIPVPCDHGIDSQTARLVADGHERRGVEVGRLPAPEDQVRTDRRGQVLTARRRCRWRPPGRRGP